MATDKRFVAKNGLDNNAKTISNLGVTGASLALSGAYTVTLTSTGTTGVTLPTTGTLATLSNTETFTSKTIASTGLNFAGSTSGNILVQAASTASGTLTLPAATDTLVGKATTDVLTNKTFDTAGTGNVLKINSTQVSDKTGTGKVVLDTSPTLTTPVLGAASATTINKVTITTPASGSTLTIADGKTLTASNTLTFTGTDSSSVAFGAGGTVTYTSNKLSVFSATSSSELAGVLSDETGTGVVVFGTSPTFTTSIDSGATFGAFASSTALTVGYTGTAASTTNISNGVNASGITKTVNIGTGGASGSTSNINIGSANGGTTTVNNDLSVGGNAVISGNLTVNGNTTTLSSTTLSVTDKNIELAKVGSPTDTTADGAGITVKGATDKTITWDSTNSNWTSSEHWNIATGKAFKINNTSVLDATTLGSTVVSSSLTSVGTIGTGTWQGTIVTSTYGGTGVNNGGRTLTISTGNLTLTAQAGGSSVTVPSTGTLATLAGTETFTNKNLSDSTTYFIDETTATKRMQFQLSGISNATTRTLTVPDVDGTIITTGDTGSVTNTMLAGSIANAKLSNSSITINGSAVSLGGSVTVSAIATAALTISTGLSGSSYNGSSAVTIAIDSSVVTLTGSQTLTNKTLTSPVISTISNTGTLTLPTSTDTLVGKATTDVFTNKTFDTAGTGNVFKINTYQITDKTGTGKAVLDTSPTISSPSITGTGSIAAGSITIDSLLLEDTATFTASSTATNQVIASVASATYRSVEFLVSITSSTNYHLTKILAIHNGTTVYMTQYGEIYSSASLADFDIDVSGGNLRLLASPINPGGLTSWTFNTAIKAIAV